MERTERGRERRAFLDGWRFTEGRGRRVGTERDVRAHALILSFSLSNKHTLTYTPPLTCLLLLCRRKCKSRVNAGALVRRFRFGGL